MTSEIRTVFELGDIAGIEIECRNCSATVLYPIGEKNTDRLMQRCPSCGDDMFAPLRQGQSPEGTPAANVAALLRLLKHLAAPGTDMLSNVRIQTKPVPHK